MQLGADAAAELVAKRSCSALSSRQQTRNDKFKPSLHATHPFFCPEVGLSIHSTDQEARRDDREIELQQMAQIPEIHPPVPSHQYLPTSGFSTSKLPPAILTIIFRFLSFANLKNVLQVCKGWREVAEQPALWKKLELVHRVGGSPECGLVEVLTMARLQSLQHLTLDFRFMDKISWEDCEHFLQVVADLCPSVRRLWWVKGGKIAMMPNSTNVDIILKRARDLVGHMAKFEEVHFFSPFVGEQQLAGGAGWSWLLKVLTMLAASDVEDSKLKVLTMVGAQPIDPAVLAVAQEKLTISINLTEDSTERRFYDDYRFYDDFEREVSICGPEGGEDYVKTSRESGLNIFISVHNILKIPKNQFDECLERLKGGVPLRSLLGCPDPTKTKFSPDPGTRKAKAKMTDEQAACARHIRQLDENRKEKLREISTRDLNILLKSKGLSTKFMRKVKEERRRLKNEYYTKPVHWEEEKNEARARAAVRLAHRGAGANYSIESLRAEVSAFRDEWISEING